MTDQKQSLVNAMLMRKPRTFAQAVNLLNEDLRRSPRETLRARRDRINRQREARMVAGVDATLPEGFVCADWDGLS